MPDGYHLGGHVALPGSLHVVEDPRMLDVLSAVDDRARRRAHLRSSLVIGERGAVLLQVFASRHRKRPLVEVVLLIDEDEQNVVTRRRRRRRRRRKRWLS